MLEDYALRFRTGRAYLVGMEMVGKRQHKKYEFKMTYQTKIGEFTPEEWKRRAMHEIQKEGETELLERIVKHCREHCAWLHKESDIQEHAIECLCSRAYEHWDDCMDEEIIWM